MEARLKPAEPAELRGACSLEFEVANAFAARRFASGNGSSLTDRSLDRETSGRSETKARLLTELS